MDIDRINAICAEIDAGAKSFGKNREWDFTAAVRPADTDTGTAPADKWAMVNRLLEGFNVSNSGETDGFMARHSIKPVPGPAGNGLEEFRGKRSKEEERILSGKEEGGLSGVSGGRFLAVDFRKEIRFRKG